MTAERPVYLDYAATTPVDPRAAAAMAQCLTLDGVFGNPASLHAYGMRSRAAVEAARQSVAALIGAPTRDVIFTSGATESNNLAVLGLVRGAQRRQRHVVTSRTEHKSVLDACHQLEREGCRVSWLEPDREGLIDPAAVSAALQPETLLVSIMHANNEIGVVQDIAAISTVCRARGVALHVDGAQSVGKLPVNVAAMGIDLLSLTAHKIYGPKGIGALYVRPEWRAVLQPLQFGGGHERGLRSGTLPVHQIVGLGTACTLASAEGDADAHRIARLRERLWSGLRDLPGVLLNGHAARRVAGILNLSFTGVEGESLLMSLPQLALSSGAACNSDTDEPSYVLRALGRDPQIAQASLRFSLGRFSTEADVDLAIEVVRRELSRLRAVTP